MDKQKEKLQKCQDQVISCIESRINNRNGDGVIQENNLGVGRGKLGLARGSGGPVGCTSRSVWGQIPLTKILWLSKVYRLA